MSDSQEPATKADDDDEAIEDLEEHDDDEKKDLTTTTLDAAFDEEFAGEDEAAEGDEEEANGGDAVLANASGERGSGTTTVTTPLTYDIAYQVLENAENGVYELPVTAYATTISPQPGETYLFSVPRSRAPFARFHLNDSYMWAHKAKNSWPTTGQAHLTRIYYASKVVRNLDTDPDCQMQARRVYYLCDAEQSDSEEIYFLVEYIARRRPPGGNIALLTAESASKAFVKVAHKRMTPPSVHMAQASSSMKRTRSAGLFTPAARLPRPLVHHVTRSATQRRQMPQKSSARPVDTESALDKLHDALSSVGDLKEFLWNLEMQLNDIKRDLTPR